MRLTLFMLAGFVWALPVYAADAVPASSLFFTKDEAARIEEMEKRTRTEHTHQGLHLGAVMFYAPDNWRVWLQNSWWTPDTLRQDLKIVAVAPNEVRMNWTPPYGPVREISLHPYQTYDTVTGQIIEGP